MDKQLLMEWEHFPELFKDATNEEKINFLLSYTKEYLIRIAVLEDEVKQLKEKRSVKNEIKRFFQRFI